MNNNIVNIMLQLLQQEMQLNSIAAHAASTAMQYGANPSIVAAARSQLGNKDFIGWCQSFVERVSGSGWKGTSAIDAWNREQNKVQGIQGIQPGDKVYFNNPNDPNGHAGIYAGNGQFISATNSGVRQTGLLDWIKGTGQKLLGYIPASKRAIESMQQYVGNQQVQRQQAPQQQRQMPDLSVSYTPNYAPPRLKQTPVPMLPSIGQSEYTPNLQNYLG